MWPMHPHYWTWWRCHKDLTLPHSFHLPGRSLGDLQTQQDHLFSLPTGESVHLFQPIVLPKGRMFRDGVNLIYRTQVTHPHPPVSILFDVCGTISNNWSCLNHVGAYIGNESTDLMTNMCVKSPWLCPGVPPSTSFTTLVGVVFREPPGKIKIKQYSSKRV